LADWIEHRGGLGAAEDVQALRRVQAFLEEHGIADFVKLEVVGVSDRNEEGRAPLHHAGYYDPTGDDGNGIYYVFPMVFKKRICAGLNFKFVRETLRQAGYLIGDSEKTRRIGGLESARYYPISRRILGQEV
jgi:hypothetical protein